MKINKNLFITLTIIFYFTLTLHANSTRASFSTSINKVCGLELIKASGNINFTNSKYKEKAQFIIRSNDKKKKTKIVFSNFILSENIKNENGYFLINRKKHVNWGRNSSLDINNNEMQEITAHINKTSNQLHSGVAKVITTIELICK